MHETEAQPPADGSTTTDGPTPEQHAEFVRLANASTPFETCCRAVGVTPAQAKSWYISGGVETAGEPLRRFRLDVDRAQARAEARNVAIIADAARENWQAAAWLLERAHPERWARASQRKGAADVKQPEQPTDPFAEVDELARRRRP